MKKLAVQKSAVGSPPAQTQWNVTGTQITRTKGGAFKVTLPKPFAAYPHIGVGGDDEEKRLLIAKAVLESGQTKPKGASALAVEMGAKLLLEDGTDGGLYQLADGKYAIIEDWVMKFGRNTATITREASAKIATSRQAGEFVMENGVPDEVAHLVRPVA